MKRKELFQMLLTLCFVGVQFATSYAQGWAKKIAQGNNYFITTSVYQQPDQSFVIIGGNLNTEGARLQRVSASGQTIAQISYASVFDLGIASAKARNGDFGLVGMFQYQPGATTNDSLVLLHLNSAGQQLWQSIIPVDSPSSIGNKAIDTTNNNGFVVACSAINSTLALIRLDSTGNIVWQNYYTGAGSYPANLYSTADEGFLAVMQVISSAHPKRLYKVDASGNFLWQYDINNSTYCNATLAQDGNILVYGTNNGNPYITKIDQNGNPLWTQNYPPLPDSATLSYLLTRDNGNFEILSSFLTNNEKTTNLLLHEADTIGNVLSTATLPLSNFGYGRKFSPRFIQTSDKGFFIGGHSFSPEFTWAIKTDSTGRAYPSTITGYVYDDANNNCLRDSSEPAFITITNITLANATDTFIATTNDSGFYSLGINEGIYDVSLESISPYWAESACNPAVITLPLNADTIVSFGYNAILQSPYIVMSAETRIPLFMPHAFVYTLEYKNIGTDVFTGYIEVELDTNLVVDSASVAWTAQNGNTFTFPVQNLGVMQKETLKIFYHPIINLDLIDRTLCFNAHAYSDTVYSVSPLWDQSDLQMMAVYNAAADSVEFTLKNKGAGDMNIPQEMIVIEDNVILVKEAVQLPAGAEIIRKLKANGATWRATVPQTDFNPYSKFTTAAIEAAGTNDIGAFSTGFINQFPVNGFYGFDYTLCALVTASYDPNAKYVLPEGAGSNHLIDSTTELEYTITFQNTGTDTAYTVRLVDTLASYLNPASIKVGVASHKFEMNFLSSNVIEFLFNNIYLPDSATDETGSQGFVKFKIKQRENNANGTVINNNAAIYFDYNTPVITNTATVQIGELTFTGIENLYAEKEVHISAYPNPFTEQATILVEGENFREMQLTVYDINGRKVKQQKAFNTNRFTIDRSGFGNGIYFFEISSEGKIIGRGKVIAN